MPCSCVGSLLESVSSWRTSTCRPRRHRQACPLVQTCAIGHLQERLASFTCPQPNVRKHAARTLLSVSNSHLQTLWAHLAINIPGPSDLLFSYRHGSSHLPLVRAKFLSRCNSVWLQNGFPAITGHSFRIGGTTELLVRGVPPDIVKMLSRWSSDSFLRYWRHLDSIAPLYVSCLQPPSCSIPSAISSSSAPSARDMGLPRGRASSSALASPRCGRIRLHLALYLSLYI
jgi:hypothetical protein